jgi:segregation and condensation protein B
MAKRKQSKKTAASRAAAGTSGPPPESLPAPAPAPEPHPPDVLTSVGEVEGPRAVDRALTEDAPAPADGPPTQDSHEEPDAGAAASSAPAEPADSSPWAVPQAPAEPPTETWNWPEGDGSEATELTASDTATEADEPAPPLEGSHLEAIIESLLFASDKPLSLSDLKRLLGERDGKKVAAAVESLVEQRKGTGIEVAALSNGWLLRTNPEHAPWVSRLLVGRPMRLSRAMLETLAIVAYRQPVTRPEIDDIRGVDCGPVLKTLLDRGLVRIIGKKEEVGRPLLYGTTPEFLRVFNLRELAELPTLREFYDLSAEDQSRVEAEHGPAPEPSESATSPKPAVALDRVTRGDLPPEPEETDPLLDELDEASRLAKRALGNVTPEGEEAQPAATDKPEAAASEATPAPTEPAE